jgi:hypothetical protein
MILLGMGVLVFVELISKFYLKNMDFIHMIEFQFGTVSDWFSTISSIATTYIAYRAYKAAPNWFSQKSKEAGFNHVTSLVTDYDYLESEIQRLHFDIVSITTMSPNFRQVVDEIGKLLYQAIYLEKKLQACKRWNIEFLPETHRTFARLRNYLNSAYSLIWLDKDSNFDKWSKAENELTKLKEIISSDSTSTTINFQDYFTFPK